jgi:hypothetical protein
VTHIFRLFTNKSCIKVLQKVSQNTRHKIDDRLKLAFFDHCDQMRYLGVKYRIVHDRQKLRFLNLTFSDLNFFLQVSIKKPKNICKSFLRDFKLKKKMAAEFEMALETFFSFYNFKNESFVLYFFNKNTTFVKPFFSNNSNWRIYLLNDML